MKARNLIAGLFIVFALSFSNYAIGQDDKGTFIEESGEMQDSTKKGDIFDFSGELDETESSGAGLYIGIAALVLLGGGIVYFVRKKKAQV